MYPLGSLRFERRENEAGVFSNICGKYLFAFLVSNRGVRTNHTLPPYRSPPSTRLSSAIAKGDTSTVHRRPSTADAMRSSKGRQAPKTQLPYPSYEGMLSFRKAVAEVQRRFNARSIPHTNSSLDGSKEGIMVIFRSALRRPCDSSLPIPVYRSTVGASSRWRPHLMRSRSERVLPDLKAISQGRGEEAS